jgi:phosphate starvation-inducible PhoH-like protein
MCGPHKQVSPVPLSKEATVARTPKRDNAKRASRPNPREDRNQPYDEYKNPHGQKDEIFQKKKVILIPRNIRQESYIDALEDDSKPIVFAMGSAGTGKTMLATYYAMQGLIAGKYDKIIITRPAVSVEESHGYLPGGILEKMQPWVLPILDYFKQVWSPQQVTKMLLAETIEISPLSFMRGRTMNNAVILADELQNATHSQVKMLLSRIGSGSKMICTGDLNQADRGYENNGLKDFVSRLRNSPRPMNQFAVVEFGREHIERHPVIDDVLYLYGEE